MGPIVLTQLATGLSVLAGAVLVKQVMDQNPMMGSGRINRCSTCNGTGRVTCLCTRWSDGDYGCRACAWLGPDGLQQLRRHRNWPPHSGSDSGSPAHPAHPAFLNIIRVCSMLYVKCNLYVSIILREDERRRDMTVGFALRL
ncbi:uncharacterized protein LOC130995628 [Salvia miltiorrhiza]|uniref:uncharacterized protein LOC130995628 n=1 Tax=Salvia miltiorrhiza TaxID=226208 RepID=UPI0025AD271B|nr:uncharacterized protein LOC130995628 [Salvia miltiorrhiza]